ncbi:hypothetical protein M378DRAFT_1039664 [Amanita muscaria Koide BX008]|uniref:Uncharacterized protein n=1 Tax=Amanita muscaria (strain Koide BX008) TaxID=946122 RepID=A0A0C2X7B5_AMAMK|nr:hypothetical protein M378DRAFT_1039664 [Amanita muscaria Koide BX008]
MNELIAFNIRVNTVNTQTFFGSPNLPRITDEPAGSLHKADMDFFAYMEDAMTSEESFVDDFAAFLLKMMGYDEGRRVIHLRKEMGFEMCGQRVDAKTDVCVMERPGSGAKDDPEPQLIAEAIAAFYETNRALRAAGLPPLQSKTFAGITMIGTAPTFYKIPVTKELLISLATTQYPPQVTTVEKLIPPVPSPERLVNDGYEAFAQQAHHIAVF